METQKTYRIPTLKRLPSYLRELRNLRERGKRYVASPALAEALGVDAITARKDMEMLGASGMPGVGFDVQALIDSIEDCLGCKNSSEAFLAGTGDFGKALLGYGGFGEYGLKIVAAFDHDPIPEGKSIHGIPVFGYSHFRHYAERLNIRLGILCTGEDEAQKTAELMVESGILAIWNFTAHTLRLPPGIIRQRVNLAGDLAVLSVKLAERLRSGDTGTLPRSAGESAAEGKKKG